MTAIVGVLNRRGVSFAADSAATHKSDSGLKISNNANKIFSLSKYHPVGVAIYNNLDFIGVPWDSIIKQFRNILKESKYDSLQEYVKPFFAFVKSNCLNALQAEQKDYAEYIIKSYFSEVNKLVKDEIGSDLNDTNAELYFKKLYEKLDSFQKDFKSNKAEDFETFGENDLENTYKDIIDSATTPLLSNAKCPDDFRDRFVSSLMAVISHNSHIYLQSLFSGLVFFGYGDKDLFPSVMEYKVTYALCNRIKYTKDYEYHISSASKDALIIPFAQTDVSNTVVRAVEDNLRQKFYENYKATLKGVKDEVIAQLNAANAPAQLVDIFNNLDIDKYTKDYREGMDKYIDKSYIQPLMETVAFLDKEDLADMAESLVMMTCLKRHVTSDAETVGGPVDVAIVTKGDGFIWKKRKHYFDPELNSQFFERNKK